VQQLKISQSTTGTYTLTVTGNTGCSSNASIAITINSTPSSPTTTPATRCGAGTVTLVQLVVVEKLRNGIRLSHQQVY
jgi:hypothetical protein